jgi:hypothetical protein
MHAIHRPDFIVYQQYFSNLFNKKIAEFLLVKSKTLQDMFFYCTSLHEKIKFSNLNSGHLRGQTIKFANSPLCACHGSNGQKP